MLTHLIGWKQVHHQGSIDDAQLLADIKALFEVENGKAQRGWAFFKKYFDADPISSNPISSRDAGLIRA